MKLVPDRTEDQDHTCKTFTISVSGGLRHSLLAAWRWCASRRVSAFPHAFPILSVSLSPQMYYVEILHGKYGSMCMRTAVCVLHSAVTSTRAPGHRVRDGRDVI